MLLSFYTKKYPLFSAALLSLPLLASANTRHFTYTYESAVLAPGQKEIETSNTWKTGKEDYFSGMNQRLEFEMGLIPYLQTSLYLNFGGNTHWETGKIITENDPPSISSEWKLKLLDPSADIMGLALYAELGLGPQELAYEGKIIADKTFDNFLVAVNLVAEQNFQPHDELLKVKWEDEVELETDLGLSYLIHNKIGLGAECRQHNIMVDGELEHSALFAGPALSFAGEQWWVSLSILPQIGSPKKDMNLDLEEYERWNTRLMFAWHL